MPEPTPSTGPPSPSPPSSPSMPAPSVSAPSEPPSTQALASLLLAFDDAVEDQAASRRALDWVLEVSKPLNDARWVLRQLAEACGQKIRPAEGRSAEWDYCSSVEGLWAFLHALENRHDTRALSEGSKWSVWLDAYGLAYYTQERGWLERREVLAGLADRLRSSNELGPDELDELVEGVRFRAGGVAMRHRLSKIGHELLNVLDMDAHDLAKWGERWRSRVERAPAPDRSDPPMRTPPSSDDPPAGSSASGSGSGSPSPPRNEHRDLCQAGPMPGGWLPSGGRIPMGRWALGET